MISVLPDITVKGVLAAFDEPLQRIPTVFDKVSQRVTSTARSESYAFTDAIPVPKVLEHTRTIQGVKSAKFDVVNGTYELTMLFDLEDFEDDQIGSVQGRVGEVGEAFATFKDQLLASLLDNGGTDLAPVDATAFFAATRPTHPIGNIDNDETSAAAGGTTPTSAEYIAALTDGLAKMRKYADAAGRPRNEVAAAQIVTVNPVQFIRGVREALNASFISQTDNVFKGLATPYDLAYLSNVDRFYILLTGSVRKPFIFQQRVPLMRKLDVSEEGMMRNNGVVLYARERFKLSYGDPSKALRHVFT